MYGRRELRARRARKGFAGGRVRSFGFHPLRRYVASLLADTHRSVPRPFSESWGTRMSLPRRGTFRISTAKGGYNELSFRKGLPNNSKGMGPLRPYSRIGYGLTASV